MTLTAAAYQGSALYGEVKRSLQVIKDVVQWAEDSRVDILCFPECFLPGYILEENRAQEMSLALDSQDFESVLKALKTENTTIILGLIEREKDKIFNTAVVIEKGRLVGKYRKHFIHHKETIFTPGTDFPIFDKNGIKYGINICYDSRFPETAEKLVKQGAQIIFCPLNNSLPHTKAVEWQNKHLEYLRTKAKTSGCWIMSADVVESSAANTGYGCTSLVSPKGEVIEYLEHLKVGKFSHTIQFISGTRHEN